MPSNPNQTPAEPQKPVNAPDPPQAPFIPSHLESEELAAPPPIVGDAPVQLGQNPSSAEANAKQVGLAIGNDLSGGTTPSRRTSGSGPLRRSATNP